MKWISVNEHNLPKGDVICWCDQEKTWNKGSLDYDGHFYCLDDDNNLLLGITHYLIIEPPKL